MTRWLAEQQGRVSTVERLPAAIGNFLEDFQNMDVQRQKAQFQTILKTVHVYRDNTIELEFRG